MDTLTYRDQAAVETRPDSSTATSIKPASERFSILFQFQLTNLYLVYDECAESFILTENGMGNSETQKWY